MSNLYYCVDCRRVANVNEGCAYCKSDNIKGLARKAPVNVIGTKVKGNVLGVSNDMVNLLCAVAGGNTKDIRQYEVKQLRKIL
ncbi:hypothetical protein Amet_3337 [Alkaliphilus metalliredigens QYMF]|uniref:Uncharacterized protein n=1 Tax=Alkaliphilus metalliredigens (strain QYMF) TaxID=293826 RepID=A6TTE7_ALKMQ|nr:hypothetical protein [Alkaliphilus metalliredigens]ABR49465.1 hypothetical protein Amet_3337 [Alkaliphilus metalliredigens QYMF]